jgi:hypothetical protein
VFSYRSPYFFAKDFLGFGGRMDFLAEAKAGGFSASAIRIAINI